MSQDLQQPGSRERLQRLHWVGRCTKSFQLRQSGFEFTKQTIGNTLVLTIGNGTERLKTIQTPILIRQTRHHDHQATQCGNGNNGCQDKNEETGPSCLLHVPIDGTFANVRTKEANGKEKESVAQRDLARRDKHDGDRGTCKNNLQVV